MNIDRLIKEASQEYIDVIYMSNITGDINEIINNLNNIKQKYSNKYSNIEIQISNQYTYSEDGNIDFILVGNKIKGE